MQINGKHYRTIWLKEGAEPTVQIIDQRKLPHALVVEGLNTLEDFVAAIRDMHVRGSSDRRHCRLWVLQRLIQRAG